MKEHQQVNFKLPKDLYDALKERVRQGDVTATDLVIEGLKHVLRLPIEDVSAHIDKGIYESIQNLESRVNQLENQDIEESIYKRIARIEEWLQQIETRYVEGNIYARIYSLEEKLDALEINIDSRIYNKTNIDKNIDSTIDGNIDSTIDSNIDEDSSKPKKEQLKLLENEASNKKAIDSDSKKDSSSYNRSEREISHEEVAELANMNISAVRARHRRAQIISYEGITYIPSGKPKKPAWRIQASGGTEQTDTAKEKTVNEEVTLPVRESVTEDTTQNLGLEEINTTRLLALIRENDPDGVWNKKKLQTIRLSKKQKDLWHEVGNYSFKWTGKKPTSPKAGSLWWLKPLEV